MSWRRIGSPSSWAHPERKSTKEKTISRAWAASDYFIGWIYRIY